MSSHKARKRFGQNFLHDEVIIHRIIQAIAPRKGEHMVEIGPGLGALTGHLLAASENLDVVELDRELLPGLLKRFSSGEGFRLHQGDALAFDFASLHSGNLPLRLVGNLPYNISTPLIFYLLSFTGIIKDMHFMLQKEVVNRLVATPNGKNFGRLSVMVQYYCHAELVLHVAPDAFTPSPKVQSAFVRLTPHKTLPHPCSNVKLLETIVREAFSLRRKTLRNSLKSIISSAQLESIGINPRLRAENLSLELFVHIANSLGESSQL